MTKTINHSTKKTKPDGHKASVRGEWLEYFDLFSLQSVPIGQAFMEHLAKEMVKWAKKKNSLTITQFLSEKGITKNSYYSWYKKNKSLYMAHQYTMDSLGSRREIGGLNRDFDASMVKFTMANYDKSWKEIEEWRSGLRTIEDNKNESKVIVIEKFKESKYKRTPEEVAAEKPLKGELNKKRKKNSKHE